MAKQLSGRVVSLNMQNTIVVEVVRQIPHPLYKKLLKTSKKIKADAQGQEVVLGQQVTIVETKPISKDKHFKLVVKEAVKKETKKEAKK